MLFTVRIWGASPYETRRANDIASILVHVTIVNIFQVMECLINIIPLFVKTNISFLTGSETFLSVVDTMINADQTYLKMAKDFILKDFPGPVLKEFGNMMATMLNTYQRYGLEDQSPLVDLWAQVLISLPSWNRSKTVLYLVNMLCIRAFFQHTSGRVVKRIFCDIFKVKTAISDF